MASKTGVWTNEDSLLALLLYHLNASDEQLAEASITRADVLKMIRDFESHVVADRRETMNSMAAHMVRAYVAWQKNG